MHGRPPFYSLKTLQPPKPCAVLRQVTRSSDMARPKRLYLVSVSVKELLEADVRQQLKVMSTGVKTFERQESKVGRALSPRDDFELSE